MAGLPLVRREGLSFWTVMDAAVPGLALGILIGRIGDLVVGDHLGRPTEFFLGYRCPEAKTASRCLAPAGGAVHLPALYDLVSVSLLLVVLLVLRRRLRYDGFLTLVFGAWYGTGRFIEDFYRIDVERFGLTGSQWTAMLTAAVCLYALVVMRRTPWQSGRAPAGAPSPSSGTGGAAGTAASEGDADG